MFNVLIDFELSKKIIISKLGITFRMMTKKEKVNVLEKIEELYFNNKKIINYFLRKYKSTNFEFFKEISCYESHLQSVLHVCVMFCNDEFIFNSKNEIEKIMDHILVIDIKEEVLSKYVSKNDFMKFVSNLLNLFDIYSKDVNFKISDKTDYTPILKYNILDFKNSDYITSLFLSIILKYKSKSDSKLKIDIKKIDLSEEFLINLRDFISKLKSNSNIDELNNFIMIVDMFFDNTDNVRIRIINQITIIETLLIKENQNIEQNFVLKMGIILKNYLKPGNNEAIQYLLKFCYNVRSCIIHGNEGKITNLFNTLTQKDDIFKSILEDDEQMNGIKNKKTLALAFCDIVLLKCTRAVINYWIKNISMVRYMKEN